MKNIFRGLLMLSLILGWSAQNASAQAVEISVADIAADAGSTVELDVTVDNFTDIVTMQFSVYWPESIAQFNSVTNLNSNLNLTTGNVVNADPGLVTVSWNDASLTPRTLEGNSLLFTIVLDIIGDECDEGPLTVGAPPAPLVLEIIRSVDGTLQEAMVNTQNATLTVNGDDCGGMGGNGEITFIAPNRTVDANESFCIPITVENFNDVVTVDLTIEYNASVLSLDNISNLNLPGLTNGNFNISDPGFVRLSWSSPSGGVSESDGTAIFEICFTAIGNNGASTAIAFVDGIVPNDVGVDDNGNIVSVDPTTQNGSVMIDGGGVFNGLELTLEDQTANENASICVPVLVQNFDRITSFSYEINFDETKLRFDSISNINLDFLTTGNFNTTTAGNGVITVVWFDNSLELEGISVPAGESIFEYCFTVIGSCPMETDIVNNPNFSGFEALDSTGAAIPFAVRTSTVDIVCGFSVEGDVNNESCADACDGSIELMINGGAAPFSISWNGPTSIPNDETNPTSLCDGTYEVTVTDNNNFTIETSFNVLSPNAFSISNANIAPAINGGDGGIDITIDGGSGNFTYSWSTNPTQMTQDATGLDPGNYTVTITDEDTGCELISPAYEVLLGFELSADITDESCNGANDGAIDLTINGGSGDFTYEWSCSVSTTGSARDLASGECTVRVTDNVSGFQLSRTFTVGGPSAITINPTITDDDGSGNGAITLNPSGGNPPYTFSWSNGETSENLSGLSANVYFVTITDQNGCTFQSGPIPVTDGNLLVVAISSEREYNGSGVSCHMACDGFIDVQAFGGVEPYSIEWGDGSVNFLREDLCPGTYSYTVTDGENAESTGEVTLTEPEALSITIATDCSNGDDGAAIASVSGGTEPYLYSWDGINFISQNSFENRSAGSNMLFIRDANGCEMMETYIIPDCEQGMDCYQGIPVITPNSDGRNDQLIISCALDRTNDLQVFDKFGQLMYEEQNYTNTWEGVDNAGQPLEEGTYIWVLRVPFNNGPTQVFNGTVTIIRNLR